MLRSETAEDGANGEVLPKLGVEPWTSSPRSQYAVHLAIASLYDKQPIGSYPFVIIRSYHPIRVDNRVCFADYSIPDG